MILIVLTVAKIFRGRWWNVHVEVSGDNRAVVVGPYRVGILRRAARIHRYKVGVRAARILGRDTPATVVLVQVAVRWRVLVVLEVRAERIGRVDCGPVVGARELSAVGQARACCDASRLVAGRDELDAARRVVGWRVAVRTVDGIAVESPPDYRRVTARGDVVETRRVHVVMVRAAAVRVAVARVESTRDTTINQSEWVYLIFQEKKSLGYLWIF